MTRGFRDGRDRGRVPLLEVSSGGVAFEDVEALARAVVAVVAPGELEIFERVVADFRRDPEAASRSVDRQVPVGLGVDFVPVAAVTLQVCAVLGQVLQEVVVSLAAQELSELTRRKVNAILRRGGRGRHTADGTGPGPVIDLAGSGAPGASPEQGAGTADVPQSGTGLAASTKLELSVQVSVVRLDAQEETEVRAVIRRATSGGRGDPDVHRAIEEGLVQELRSFGAS